MDFVYMLLLNSEEQELMRSGTKEHQTMYHTLFGPILCQILHPENAPYR